MVEGSGGDGFTIVAEGEGGEVVVMLEGANVGESGVCFPEAEGCVMRASGGEKGTIWAKAADDAEW